MESIFFTRYCQLCRGLGKSPNGLAKELGIPSGSISAWKRGAMPHNSRIVSLADHFKVSPDYLCGKTDNPQIISAPEIIAPVREDIKFALFGGDGEVTDAMLEEVFQFAQFVKHREGLKKKE